MTTPTSGLRWLTDPYEARRLVVAAQSEGSSVGLVPTMGNLHEGHLSLVRQAKANNDVVVVTIFVNPIQFCEGEDLSLYPRTPEADCELCGKEGVDVIFAPSVESMYPADSRTRIQVTELEQPLCGANRPGHFVGVATVVAKLFNIVPADNAYFGSKDYQQAKLIKRMAADLDFAIAIHLCPIVREPDGLAMSSRNRYLNEQERADATILHQALAAAKRQVDEGANDPALVRHKISEAICAKPTAEIDYVEIVDAESFLPVADFSQPRLAALAVRFGNARLIDNMILG